MSPAMPSATASSTRPAQRERGARRMKSSSMRCIKTPLLARESKFPITECFCSPRVVHLGIKLPLGADDHAGHRLRKAQESALALQDLGQHVAPAFVGAAAADRDPRAALDERER